MREHVSCNNTDGLLVFELRLGLKGGGEALALGAGAGRGGTFGRRRGWSRGGDAAMADGVRPSRAALVPGVSGKADGWIRSPVSGTSGWQAPTVTYRPPTGPDGTAHGPRTGSLILNTASCLYMGLCRSEARKKLSFFKKYIF